MLLVISPSKTQTMDVPVKGDFTRPLFVEQAEQLVTQLKRFTGSGLAELMKMSPKLANQNFSRYQNFQFPFTTGNSCQALFMFQGDQFKPMDVHLYSKEMLEHAQHHLAIFSGLYGLIRPLDLMQPYRLEMATKLGVGEAKNLYQYWSSRVTREVNTLLANDPHPVLVNLASAEYFKVINKKELQVSVLTISFKQYKNDTLKTIAIYAKRARGAMVNFMIRKAIIIPEELQKFSVDGYLFAPDLSSELEWVFTRRLD